MPIYEYHCGACDSNFEVLVRGAETPICPQCEAELVNQLLSVPAAPVAGKGTLPVCGPQPPASGGCGLPQCGTGRCGGGAQY